MAHRRGRMHSSLCRRSVFGRRSRCFGSLVLGSCVVCLMLVMLGVNDIHVPQLVMDNGQLAQETVFLGNRNIHNNAPVGQSKMQVAIETVPQKHRLLEVQQEILGNQNRPPDSAYNYNVSLSDSLSLDRTINDTRPKACQAIAYNIEDLPPATVVIPFYNEALSMLLRTIHSVLNRTPDRLIHEIILVDDCSSHEYLRERLNRYVALLPKVRLIRNYQREGLIRSRLRGADISTAPVVVFLDAHTEANVGWLEPMLAEIKRKPNSVVQPFVDGVDIKTMEYAAPGNIHRGGFSWDLRYVWMKVPEHLQDSALMDGTNYWSPVLVGCAIAVDKAYFNSIGAFDSDQIVWGGENIELSFRTWMCGGTVTTVPCSRVGHVFRPLPYRSEMQDTFLSTWQKNLMRVAEVWMDHYKKYFYRSTRIYAPRRVNLTAPEWESLGKRIKLKEKLQCKSFSWYLANVIPELPIPPQDAVQHGQITSYRSNACWEVMEDGYLSITFGCFEHKLIVDNQFTLTNNGFLLYKDQCVTFMFPKPILKVQPCPAVPGHRFGLWSVGFNGDRWGQIQVDLTVNGKVSRWCVAQVTSAVTPHLGAQMPQAAFCDSNNLFQFWSFDYRFDFVG